ncbi:HEAT repeat domain-containing protein, partial [Kitasatospora cineracea]|uniref:HEAT repeat domain-containing protein n=1 Tax=Kitasatospora cineracea TaxID=88074 RepID=UPI0033E4310D
AAAAGSADPVVRAGVQELARVLRGGSVELFAAGLCDAETAVRLQAVRGLVSLDAADALAAGATDPAREVRVAVGEGLGVIGDPASAAVLAVLAEDPDPLVRAGAFTGAAGLGGALAELAERPDPAWQVRKAAAGVLGAAGRWNALTALATDGNGDVRKAAVRAMAAGAAEAHVAAALRERLTDGDADVRAYARLALGGA